MPNNPRFIDKTRKISSIKYDSLRDAAVLCYDMVNYIDRIGLGKDLDISIHGKKDTARKVTIKIKGLSDRVLEIEGEAPHSKENPTTFNLKCAILTEEVDTSGIALEGLESALRSTIVQIVKADAAGGFSKSVKNGLTLIRPNIDTFKLVDVIKETVDNHARGTLTVNIIDEKDVPPPALHKTPIAWFSRQLTKLLSKKTLDALPAPQEAPPVREQPPIARLSDRFRLAAEHIIDDETRELGLKTAEKVDQACNIILGEDPEFRSTGLQITYARRDIKPLKDFMGIVDRNIHEIRPNSDSARLKQVFEFIDRGIDENIQKLQSPGNLENMTGLEVFAEQLERAIG